MIEDAKQLADYVIIDSPPLTEVVDALPLASLVDDVLLVVTPRQDDSEQDRLSSASCWPRTACGPPGSRSSAPPGPARATTTTTVPSARGPRSAAAWAPRRAELRVLGRLDPAQRLIPALFGVTALFIGLLAGFDPKLAVAGSLGIAFLLVALANITAGLVAFTLVVFLELAPAAGGPALSFTKIAGAILALSFLARYSTRQRHDDVFWTAYPAYACLLGAFVVWTAASVFWAEDPSVALASVSRLALNAALFVIVLEAVRTRRAVTLVMGALIAGAGVAAVYGVVAPPNAAEFAYSSTSGSGLGRLAGTVGDPNELASLLVVGLILSLALATAVKDGAVRSVIVGIGVLCALGAFLTASRGGLVALAGGLITAILIAPRRRLMVIMVSMVVAVGTVGYFTAFAPEGARERLTLGDGGTGRTDIWKIGWRMVEAHPCRAWGSPTSRSSRSTTCW